MNAIGEQISAILWNVFNRPRLIDLIDILLLTIIIYELLVHVRQTRVSQTIKGIIILLLATWLSDVLGMRTIHALLAWMINAGPVLLIVLFQSEIRRILHKQLLFLHSWPSWNHYLFYLYIFSELPEAQDSFWQKALKTSAV